MSSLLSVESAVVLLLVIGLPLYNFFANRWPPFNGALYVPMNLVLLAVVLVLALGPLDLAPLDLTGLQGPDGALAGLVIGLGVALPLFLLTTSAWGRRRLIDERVAHLSDKELLYQALVRVPLGTALVEEVVFRGVLVAAWLPSGEVTAALASSAVFGLWHVGPSINLVRANNPHASSGTLTKTIVGAVVFTTLAGLLFAWLRFEAGLWGPVAMHAIVNGLATVASVLAYRKERSLTSRG